MPQHRVGQRLFAVTGFVVIPVGDFQTAFHFQFAAVSGVPLAEKVWEIAIENEMVGAGRMFDGNIDFALGGFEGNLRGLEDKVVLLRIDYAPSELDLERRG